MLHRIALSHASGIAGEAIREKLPESGISSDSLVLLGDEMQCGTRLAYAGGHLKIRDWREFDFSECSLLLMPEADAGLEAAARQQGCLVISHTLDTDPAPIFVGAGDQPEIAYNVDCLRLAGPELACLLPLLRQLDRQFELEQINLTLLRGAEFHGKAGVEELASQTVSLLNAREAVARILPAQLAFNLLPEGSDRQLVSDLNRILGNNSFPILLQTIMVPVFHGFAAAVQLACSANIDLNVVRRQLSTLDNLRIRDDRTSPIADCNQSFSCVISHLEQLPTQPSSLQCWMIADPIRYGLANNYVNVTDFLLKSFL